MKPTSSIERSTFDTFWEVLTCLKMQLQDKLKK
jgi:hypothetical protein